jgi:uncharacterized integral membrane protein
MAQEQTQSRRRVPIRLIVVGVLLLLLVVFIAQNFDSVEMSFLGFEWDMRLAWALIIVAIGGFLAGMIVPKFRRRG